MSSSEHAAGIPHHDPAEIDRHVKVYITVFVALMILTIVTVAISYLHLPVHTAIGIAMIVATIKGSLVACYFMHLISEKKLIYAVLTVTFAFFIVLLALPSFTSFGTFGTHDPQGQPASETATLPGHR